MTQQQLQGFKQEIERLRKEKIEEGDYAIGMVTCSVCEEKKLTENFDLEEAVDLKTGYIICNQCIEKAVCQECGNPDVLSIEEWADLSQPECYDCQDDRRKYEGEDYRDA